METKKREELETLGKEELISYIEELVKERDGSEFMKDLYRREASETKKKLELIYDIVELTKK